MLTLLRRPTARRGKAGRSPVEPSWIKPLRVREQQLFQETTAGLRSRCETLREQADLAPAGPLDYEWLNEAIALAAAAAQQALGIQFYDVQLFAGLMLARGNVAEMATGEGKTYTTAIPALVHALAGRGVHVATSNAYLAERDCRLLQPLFELLGLTASFLKTDQSQDEKRAAYRADVTFGPGYEFGFDYLRDQLAARRTPPGRLGDNFLRTWRGEDRMPDVTALQRRLAVTIVDEIDNVLIDDAASPLVLSGMSDQTAPDAAAHQAALRFADALQSETDFQLNTVTGAIKLTANGHTRIWGDSSVPLKVLMRPWNNYIEQALRAKCLFRRDVHYVIRDGKVVIVDQSTGRLFAERTWSDGLHQAIEAREGINITAETLALARVTRQRFARLYPSRCGMSGTVTESADEFREFFQWSVTPIPLRLPSRRTLLRSRFFATSDVKWEAIVSEVERRHQNGQPVLIGTRSIHHSEQLAERLRSAGVTFQLLNGMQDADEAAVIAQAGLAGTVTIATNMAGRGTDIRPDAAALQAGGLHVIATEHHDSVRIDRQLIGRAARQGEPGSAAFFVSAADDLLVRYGDDVSTSMRRAATRTGELDRDFTASVRQVQQRVEQQGYRQRRHLFQEDQRRDVLLSRIAGGTKE